MTLIKGKKIYPGINDEVALDQARCTITNVVDAIVELITNSNDSYLKLEQEGNQPSGIIEIGITRKKGV